MRLSPIDTGVYRCTVCATPVRMVVSNPGQWGRTPGSWAWADREGSTVGVTVIRHETHVEQRYHAHHAIPDPVGPTVVAQHCGRVAYRSPSGWFCRACRVFLGGDVAVGFNPGGRGGRG